MSWNNLETISFKNSFAVCWGYIESWSDIEFLGHMFRLIFYFGSCKCYIAALFLLNWVSSAFTLLIFHIKFLRYVDLKACITRLPENGYGSNIKAWPARLHEPPDRLQDVQMDAYLSKKELFKAESNYWNDIIEGYVRVFHMDKMKLRNVMDMRAGFGG